jgi:acyl carrier protein
MWYAQPSLRVEGALEAVQACGDRGSKMEGSFATPQTEIELKIARAWQEVLGVETVGMQDNFFDLGGNSLLIIQLYEKLRQVLGTQLQLTELFQYPTISSLANYLKPQEAASLSIQLVQDRAEKQREALNRQKQQIIQRAGE